MSNVYDEARKEIILAEADIVRAKRRERQAKMDFYGVDLDDLLGEETEMVLATEEKILLQEAYVLKLRSLREENTEQTKGMSDSTLEEFVQGILSHFGLEEGEAIVFLDPKGERVALEEQTCLVSMLLNKVEEIEEQIAQLTAENSKDVLKKLTSLKEFIVENTENINIR